VRVNTVLIRRRSSNTLYCDNLLHLAIIISYSKLFLLPSFHTDFHRCSYYLSFLSLHTRTRTHRYSYCFLLFRRTLAIVCVAFLLFSRPAAIIRILLYPLMDVLLFCCFHGMLPLFVLLSVVSTACSHYSYCFRLFSRYVAIVRIAFGCFL